MSLSRIQLHKYRTLPLSQSLEPRSPRQLRRPKHPLVASLPTAETRRLRKRSFPTSIRQNRTTTTKSSGPVIRGTLSQIPAAPTRAPTSHLPTTTTVTRTNQLSTLRKTQNRTDISKLLSTPFHPTGTVGRPGRTSKKHFRCQNLTGTTFQGRLSSGTPTLTGLWPVARQAPSRRQKSSTLPLRSCACNFIVATSLLRSIPSSTRTRAGIWKTIDFVSLESTSSCLPDLISSRASKGDSQSQALAEIQQARVRPLLGRDIPDIPAGQHQGQGISSSLLEKQTQSGIFFCRQVKNPSQTER
jgi:hypothetical protein